eukprot:SAG11_NODE_23289_length_391_cov_1.205479_1_plen_48_part_10
MWPNQPQVTFDMSKSKVLRDSSGPLRFSIAHGECVAQFVAADSETYEI